MKAGLVSLVLCSGLLQISAQAPTRTVPVLVTPPTGSGQTPGIVTGLTPTQPANGPVTVNGFQSGVVGGFTPQAASGFNPSPVGGYNQAPVGGFTPNAVGGFSQSPVTISPTPQVATPNPVSGFTPVVPIPPPVTNSNTLPTTAPSPF